MQPQTKQSAERTIAPITTFDVDLSTARDQVIPLQGDFFMIDMASTGTALIDINVEHQSTDPLVSCGRGFRYSGPFGNFRLKNTAQPGRFLRIVVSRGAAINPAASDGRAYSEANPNTRTVDFYSSSSVTGGNNIVTTTTPFPHGNANGMLIHHAWLRFYNIGTASYNRVALIASKNATGFPIDGNIETVVLASVLSPPVSSTSTLFEAPAIKTPFIVPAGWRVYVAYSLTGGTIGYHCGVTYEAL